MITAMTLTYFPLTRTLKKMIISNNVNAVIMLYRKLVVQKEYYGIVNQDMRPLINRFEDGINTGLFFTTKEGAEEYGQDLIEQGTFRPSEICVLPHTLADMQNLGQEIANTNQSVKI